MNKKIVLKNKVFSLLEDENIIMVGEQCINNYNKPYKSFTLSKWDDYNFVCYKEIGYNETSFRIDIDNPLHDPLYNFLGNDKEIVINSDEDSTSVIIKRKLGYIYVIFNDYNKSRNKMEVFIKNIYGDPRSNLNKDVALRLDNLFEEIKEEFKNIEEKNKVKEKKVAYN